MLANELSRIASIEEEAEQGIKHQINVCVASGCLTAHSDQVKEALATQVRKQGLHKECLVKGVGCLGLCAAAPTVSVEPEGILYQKVTPADATDIVTSLGNMPLKRLKVNTDHPFFHRQMKMVMENSGKIDPTRIEDYIVAGGYIELHKTLNTFTPMEVID